jgi:signal transduction histidine kinase
MSPVRYVLVLAGVGVTYWVAARLSLNLALVNGQVTPIWPPSGIALVAFLILGRRAWPAIALAAFAVNLPIGPTPLGAALIAGGNTVAPLLASELLRRAGFHPELDRMRDAVAIVFLGALLGMMLSATIGSAVLALFGAVPMSRFWSTWAVWWAGDAMGVLLVAPLLLAFVPRRGVGALTWTRRIELFVMLTAVGAITYFLFQNQFRLEYLVLPLIALAAWRFRLQGAAPAALIASVVAAWAAVHGDGPFAHESLLEKMVTLQAFNISVSLASFVLASFADAREQREEVTRLYQSVKLAIAAKTDAIDVAAHELGPPVAVLTSYLAILADGTLGPPPAKWKSILNVMSDKAWHVNRIMADLVDAARIEGNSQRPRRDQMDLRIIVKDAIKRATPRAELAGAEIATKLGSQPMLVDGDARQIGRILDNLINNSLTYVTKSPRVKVDTGIEGDRAVVHVIDNGVGMSEAERARVFQPFQRTKDPAIKKVPGVGLGLYASRQLAEINNGRLRLLKSEPGLGSSFALDLPLAKRDEPATVITQSDPQSPAGKA